MRRSTRKLIVPPLIAAFVFSGCLAATPRDVRTEHGIERTVPGPVEGFGYLSAGYVARADLYGEIDGIEPGSGWTTTLPLAPGTLYVALVAVVVVAAASGDGGGGDLQALDLLDLDGLDEGTWHSGMSDPRHVVVSELSFDLTFSTSRHRDSQEGGSLDYTAVLVGMRLGGPRRYVPRYYFTGGWGWYGFRYDERTEAHVRGPYVGGGLELFADPWVALGLDYKVHYCLGEDEDDEPVDAAMGLFSANITWYF
ncbi:MAG: hypothetical protein ACYTFI_25830 [Planctomycetota bacterium]|jgi:hypothetical protein